MDPIERRLRLLDEQLGEKSLHNWLFSRSPLFILAWGFVAGVILQNRFNISIGWWLGVLGVSTIAASVFLIRSKSIYAAVYGACIGFACLGAMRLANFYQPDGNDIRNLVGNERIMARIRGTVSSKVSVEDKDGWVFGRYTWSKAGSSFYLKVRQVKTESGWAEATGSVRVQVSGPVEGIEVGDYVQMYCWLGRFEEALNPGQFDIKKYLAQKGILVGASVGSGGDSIEVLKYRGAGSYLRIKNKLQSVASAALFGEGFSEEKGGGLPSALFLGERGNIDSVTYAAFLKTGLAHFICLSGLHMGILAGFIWWLCRVAGLTKRWRAIICIIFTLLYVAIVPPRAATLRAAVICWFFCVSVIVRKKPNALNALSLAAIVGLVLRPGDVFNAGWQLSYTTVLGITLLYGRIANGLFGGTVDKISAFQSNEIEGRFAGVCRFLAVSAVELFSVGIAAWLGGAGILLYHFGTIAPTASLWTVLVFPLVLVLLAVGFLKMVLAILLPTAGMMLGLVLIFLSDLLSAVVRFAARVDKTQLTIGKVGVVLIVGYYCFVLLVRFGRFDRGVVKKTVCTVLALVIVVSSGLLKYQRSRRDYLEVTCLAVGHGQAIFAALPGTETMLFDAGSISTKDCGRRIVVEFLRQKGITEIDSLILSHADIDHINGIPEIVSGCKTGGVYANSAVLGKAESLSTAGFLNEWLGKHNKPLQLLDNIEINSGAKIDLVWPVEATGGNASISENDKSQVVLLEFAGRGILLCSDIERFAQEQILETYPDLKADVVVMPHHGSTRNLIDGFVERIRAETVIISCSRKRYETAFVPREGVRAFYTPIDGAITVKIRPDGSVTVNSMREQ